MKIITSIIISLLLTTALSAQSGRETVHHINDDISVFELTPEVFVHVSASELDGFGRVSSNGMIMVEHGTAFLVDTPATEEQTRILHHWIEQELGAELRYFYGTHWHSDCIGGLVYLNYNGIETYSHYLTREICRERGLPVTQNAIGHRYSHEFYDFTLEAYYPGPGHTTDNVVVHLPGYGILFGGCLVKDVRSTHLGNTADGDISQWPQSIINVMMEYPDVRTVIPGHGRWGGPELLDHTLKLAFTAKEREKLK